jgi:ribose transport system ATP-binding protein
VSEESRSATAGAAATPLVGIERLSKTFPGQRALAEVSFDIATREIHALVGENGSGKSTLIKILSGFHVPDPGGVVRIDGEPLQFGSAADARRRGLRFVHQDLGLIPELTGAENVGLVSGFTTSATRIDRAAQRHHTQRLLGRIGVEFNVERPVAELRAVERSALAIARALDDSHGEIALLVLDEPTAALPPAECETLFAVLREVVAAGVSILYVSHRLDEVLTLASRVTVLRDGACQGTIPTVGVDRGRLARLIVGQDVELTGTGQTPPEARADDAVLRVRDLRCYPLAGVNFDVRPGEVLGIAGLSGSGREVLAGAVCGALPAALELALAGARIEADPMTPQLARELKLALVLPNRHPEAAIANFTISENMTLGRVPEFARHGRVDRRRERAAVREWIQRLDIRPPDPDRVYGLLSGGNQQKVLLAKWFGIDPRVVFMDDPTSGVDIGARYAIYDLIREHARGGAGFVICSSDIEDLVSACDRVIALVDGHLAEELHGTAITESELLRAISGSAQPAPAPV